MKRFHSAACAMSIVLCAGCGKRASEATPANTAVESTATQVSTPTAAASSTDSATINGTNLRIETSGDGCVVRVRQSASNRNGDSLLMLSPKSPCYFLRRGSTDPMTMSYADARVTAVTIIVGTAASTERRKNYDLKDSSYCGTETQAVLFRNDSVVLSKSVRRDTFVCRDHGVDEKEFWAFAHDDK